MNLFQKEIRRMMSLQNQVDATCAQSHLMKFVCILIMGTYGLI